MQFSRRSLTNYVCGRHLHTLPGFPLQAVTNMFATLKESTVPIEVSVGGVVVASAAPADTMAAPTVVEVPPQHCGGLFAACDADCKQVYKVTQVQSGAARLSLFSLATFHAT